MIRIILAILIVISITGIEFSTPPLKLKVFFLCFTSQVFAGSVKLDKVSTETLLGLQKVFPQIPDEKDIATYRSEISSIDFGRFKACTGMINQITPLRYNFAINERELIITDHIRTVVQKMTMEPDPKKKNFYANGKLIINGSKFKKTWLSIQLKSLNKKADYLKQSQDALRKGNLKYSLLLRNTSKLYEEVANFSETIINTFEDRMQVKSELYDKLTISRKKYQNLYENLANSTMVLSSLHRSTEFKKVEDNLSALDNELNKPEISLKDVDRLSVSTSANMVLANIDLARIIIHTEQARIEIQLRGVEEKLRQELKGLRGFLNAQLEFFQNQTEQVEKTIREIDANLSKPAITLNETKNRLSTCVSNLPDSCLLEYKLRILSIQVSILASKDFEESLKVEYTKKFDGLLGREINTKEEFIKKINNYFIKENWIELGKASKPLVKLLIKALEDEESQIRENAAEALGKTGHKGSIEPLVLALKDENSDVRVKAVRALGEIKDTRAIEPLIVALKDSSSVVLADAANALKKITGEDFGKDPAKWQKWWEENKEVFLKTRQ